MTPVDYGYFQRVGDLFQHPLTLVNVAAEDQPLVFVNKAFCELTGYSSALILGRNCRFLQGIATDKNDVDRIREAISLRQAIFCDILNYKIDGAPFFNRLVLVPLNFRGIAHYVGMQIDSTTIILMILAGHPDNSFDNVKTSEFIKDRINNALMKIELILGDETDQSFNATAIDMLEKAFGEIHQTVLNLPLLAVKDF